MNIHKIFFTIICLLTLSISFAQVPFPDEEMPIDDEIMIPDEATEGDRLGYYNNGGKRGLIVNKIKITEPIYDKVQIKTAQGFIVKKGDYFGFINKKGKETIPVKYDLITDLGYRTSYLSVGKKGKFGVFTTDGSKALPLKYAKIFGVNNAKQFVVHDKNEQLLLVQKKGKTIASDIEKVYLYENGSIIKSKGKFGIFTSKSSSGFVYDTISISSIKKNQQKRNKRYKVRPYNPKTYIKLDKIVVKKEGKVGMIDTLQNVLIPIEYENLSKSRTSYYVFEKDKKKGFYLTKCNKFFAPKYDNLYMDGTTYLQITIGRKKGLIDDASGEQILPVEYDKIYKTGKKFIVTKDKKKGVANRKGEIIIPLNYTDIDHLGGLFNSNFNDFYKVKLNEKFGIVNSKHETIIPIKHELLSDFEEGLILVIDNKKFGLYGLDGTLIQKPTFDFIERERSQLAKIFITRKDGLYGAINREGKVVFENEYTDLYSLPNAENDLQLPYPRSRNFYQAIKHTNGKEGVLDIHSGKLEIPLAYDKIYQTIKDYENGEFYFVVKKGGKFGIINSKNKPVLDIKYDSLNAHFTYAYSESKENPLANATIVAEKNGNYGVVNLLGQTVIPFEYTAIQKVSHKGLFKAKKKDHYVLINNKNQILNAGPFDEIANFEYSPQKAMSFYNGQMRMLSETGKFLTPAVAMKPHVGYTSMKEVKEALITALNSPDDELLREFAQKIAPSEHLMYFFKNMDGKVRSRTQFVDYELTIKKYFFKLLEFKRHTWNSDYYNKANLHTEDFTISEQGIITNKRIKNWAYGDTRILEKILRNSMKINGYWISSYFTRSRF